jgi:hypothetical protein
MGFLILLLVIPVLALVAQRDDFKRIILIALGLEVAKYAFFLLVNPRSEFSSFLFSITFLIAMLPEFMIGGEFGPGTIWSWVTVLCAGIIWNLTPAYFISLLLPERQPEHVEA